MKIDAYDRELFDPNNVPLLGSLGLLALGDIGFSAWRKAKINNGFKKEYDEAE
ncbi:hypothetical protein [Aequorivita echinoideorum]|uniref:Uncharacterized protein n=1 Tax=Aequorivita echinoideorum TaxID=1549647 RepID=A0ABS5S0B5_9FLAO|nr:hypothetical protein [Aequorivita echinoideorum]MBT0606647.1 hypothetical protein [Aequorivita echinoideorum]